MATLRYPTAPGGDPAVSTLLDVSATEERMDFGALVLAGEPWFDSYDSMQFRASADWCGNSDAKVFDQETEWAYPFFMVAYGGHTCSAVGLDRARRKAEMKRVFEAGESTAVEMGLMDMRFSPGVGAPWAAPTDITPAGGPQEPVVALALLEEWISQRYVGKHIVHAPTSVASLLAAPKHIEPENGVLRSALGTYVVNGAGYGVANVSPTGFAAAAGTKWVYVSGPVLVAKGGDTDVLEAFSQSDNEVPALIERPYVVATDGPVAGIKVQVAA